MIVRIKDFQVLKDVELEFEPGITVIVGNSNNGKSSIIRALEYAINNKGGNSFINYNADSTVVEIEDNENKVIWTKHKKQGKSSYTINGEVLEKIGQKQLDDVADLFNMGEVVINNEKIRLNFWKQMSFPFLVGKTPYQLFDFISKNKEQDVINNLQSDKTDELRQKNKELDNTLSNIDLRIADIKNLDAEIKSLSKFEDFDISKAEALVSFHNKLNSLINTEVSINSKKSTLVSKVDKDILKINTLSSYTKKLSSNINDYINIKRLYDKLNATNSNISNTKLILEKGSPDILINKVENMGKLLDKHNNILAKLTPLRTLFKTLNTSNLLISNMNNIINNNNKDIITVKAELAEFKVCPTCLQPLTGGHKHG